MLQLGMLDDGKVKKTNSGVIFTLGWVGKATEKRRTLNFPSVFSQNAQQRFSSSEKTTPGAERKSVDGHTGKNRRSLKKKIAVLGCWNATGISSVCRMRVEVKTPMGNNASGGAERGGGGDAASPYHMSTTTPKTSLPDVLQVNKNGLVDERYVVDDDEVSYKEKLDTPYSRKLEKGFLIESPPTDIELLGLTESATGEIGPEDFTHPETSTPTKEAEEKDFGRRKLQFGKKSSIGNEESSLETSSTTISSPQATAGSSIKDSSRLSSLSFEERFKYKISMYSKVSGCRMTNIPDYTIVKQVRALILQKIAMGNPNDAVKIKFAYEKMKNGGLQIITDDKRLSDALSDLSYFAAIPCKVTFPNSPRVVGFVKNLPINLEPAELKREIKKALPEVYSVRYIAERNGNTTGFRTAQLPSAFVSFNLRYLPGSVFVYGKEYEVQVPNPMQCTRCCRYGHQGKQCRADVRCPYCAKPHTKQLCVSQFFRCVNCKGPHPSTSHECLVWQQGKHMNELRYRGGLSAEEAIDVATEGKIQHKKHSFTFPSEYFENLETFYLDGSDNSGNSEETTENSNNEASGNSDPDQEESYDFPRKFFHVQYLESQKFLDTITDLYLQLANPGSDFTSASLMPGFEDDSMMERLNPCGKKRTSKVAEQFKLCVIQAMVAETEVGDCELTENDPPPSLDSCDDSNLNNALLSSPELP